MPGPAGVLKQQMMSSMAGMTQLSGAAQPSQTTALPRLPSVADREVFSLQRWQVALRAAGVPQFLKLNAVAMSSMKTTWSYTSIADWHGFLCLLARALLDSAMQTFPCRYGHWLTGNADDVRSHMAISQRQLVHQCQGVIYLQGLVLPHLIPSLTKMRWVACKEGWRS